MYQLLFNVMHQLQSTLLILPCIVAPFIQISLSMRRHSVVREKQYVKGFNKDHPFKSKEVVVYKNLFSLKLT